LQSWQPRAYPGLILEGEKWEKNSGGKILFFAQKYHIFSTIDHFFRKICPSGCGAATPLSLPGYALAGSKKGLCFIFTILHF